MTGMIFRAGMLILFLLAAIFVVFLSLLIVAAVLLILAGILLALYFVVAKKPRIEQDGTWTLDRVRGKRD
ncbi:MAG: hypothetical protein PHZ19_04740 [Candidatus Thermoplasmatota archaeon]|nr:hypothetical protein [Candidatus Thermoplasmatota archaeon]